MRGSMIWLFAAVAFSQQPAPAPKSFAATATLGKPFVIGEDPDDYGRIKVDYAKKFEITLGRLISEMSSTNPPPSR